MELAANGHGESVILSAAKSLRRKKSYETRLYRIAQKEISSLGKDMSDKPKEPSFKGTQPGSMLRLSLGSEERQVFEMATGKGGGILLFKQMET